jgi:hypothetical protein
MRKVEAKIKNNKMKTDKLEYLSGWGLFIIFAIFVTLCIRYMIWVDYYSLL